MAFTQGVRMTVNLDRAALIVIDVQNDFCPGGKLAVKDGDIVVPVINSLAEVFPKTVATMDWHPKNHVSFATNHSGMGVFDIIDIGGVKQVLWPEHCVQGMEGADFHPDLDDRSFDLILRKGTSPSLDSYSAFGALSERARGKRAVYLRSCHGLLRFLFCD